GDNRRSEIAYGLSTEFNEADLVRVEECVLLLTQQGYINRVPSSAYRAERRGGKGVIGVMRKEEDFVADIVTASGLDHVLYFSNKVKVYSERAYAIPEGQRASKGTSIYSVLNNLDSDERITAILP